LSSGGGENDRRMVVREKTSAVKLKRTIGNILIVAYDTIIPDGRIH
jgi:hypothetical protein